MAEQAETQDPRASGLVDPRALLADWANSHDEWVRLLVSEVIATGRPVGDATVENAYQLFRQEKALDKRGLPAVAELNIEARQDESAPSLTLTKLSEVYGVNALVVGEVIEPHEGLTILYGENGTGKTGYSRIFKALADASRRYLLDLLFARDGQTLTELESKLQMTRFGVMKHLRVLEAAGLVITRWSGREKLHFLNPVPIRLIHNRWIHKYAEHQVSALADLKAELEAKAWRQTRKRA